MVAKPAITVRHYCQGIGDAHLIRFTREDGSDAFMLIDCGIHTSVRGGPGIIDKIVEDVAEATGKRLDILVVTHEHWDHVSAFTTAKEAFADFDVGAVWMGWTENPEEEAVQELDRFKQLAAATSEKVAVALSSDSPGLSERIRNGLEALSGFYVGLKGERVRGAREAAKALSSSGVTYLDPATPPFQIPGIDGVRVYVLGPPRDRDLLKLTERASEMYHFALSRDSGLAAALAASPDPDDYDIDMSAPFDLEEGEDLASALQNHSGTPASIARILADHYLGPEPSTGEDQSWRRIDEDWLYAAADVALQYDSRTNNTSLVLAFEFIDSGRVALFPGDAQIGNWLGWKDLEWEVDDRKVTGSELLKRTVFYKASHHASQNATPEANGLELMTSPDLSAFVPTNHKDARKVGWKELPFEKILSRLAEKTAGRVICADDDWVSKSGDDAYGALTSGSIVSITHKPGLWVEIGIA